MSEHDNEAVIGRLFQLFNEDLPQRLGANSGDVLEGLRATGRRSG